jgi:hypothetical protein
MISWRVFQFQVLFSMLFRCCHQPLQVRIRTPEAVVNCISFSLGPSWLSTEEVVFMIKMFYWPNQSMWLNSIEKTNLGKTQKKKHKFDLLIVNFFYLKKKNNIWFSTLLKKDLLKKKCSKMLFVEERQHRVIYLIFIKFWLINSILKILK